MMYNSKALLSTALLTGASLAQSSANNLQCTQSYASLLAGAPTPDAQLLSAITSYASTAGQSVTGTNADPLAIATQVCEFSSNLPQSLHSDFDAYVTQVISFVSASSSAIDAVITDCVATGSNAAQGAAYTSIVNSLATHTGPLCQATGTPGGNNGTSGTNGTVTTGLPYPSPTQSGANGGGSTSPVPTGAAAVPSAVFGAAAAAAGILGVAALL